MAITRILQYMHIITISRMCYARWYTEKHLSSYLTHAISLYMNVFQLKNFLIYYDTSCPLQKFPPLAPTSEWFH